MTVFSLGQVSARNNEAHIIDSNHFASVVIGNPNAVTVGSEREASFNDATSYLGITAIRWPGGSEAERDFDWRTDASTTHRLDLSDLRTAIDYSAENGLNLSFTFPTSEFKGMSDGEIDDMSAQIRAFIVDELLAYADEKNVVIDSIKIGNEPDLNNLSAGEYGQIASRLSSIIGESLDVYGNSRDAWSEPELVVESGRIWLQETRSGLFFGDRDHNGVMDAQEIKDAFNSIEAGYVDAVDIHSMTLFLSSYEDYFGEGPYSSADLNTVYGSLSSFWDDTFQDVELHTLAWQYPWRRDVDGPNGSGGVEDHGGSALINASLGFMHYHEMSLAGVSYAVSWLASGWGGASPTLYHNEPRAGGEVFKLMQENISGLRAVEFDQDPTIFQNDSGIEDVVFKAFEQNGNVVLYIGNLETESQTITINDVLQLLISANGFDSISSLNDIANLHVWGTRLGVEGDPTDYSSTASIDILNLEDLVSSTNPREFLEFSLGAYEIMQLSFSSSDNSTVEMHGHDQDDTLVGSAWNDVLLGWDGNDVLIGGSGDDLLDGGQGSDAVKFNVNVGDVIVEDLGEGTVRISSDLGRTLVRNTETFIFIDDTLDLEALLTLSTNDTVVGDDSSEEFILGLGDDTVSPGGGLDVMYLGGGADTVVGTPGDLNGDIIVDFTNEDKLIYKGVDFSLDQISITYGSTIIGVDLDNDGVSDTTIKLEGDFEFVAVSLETIDGSTVLTTNYINQDLFGTTGNDVLTGNVGNDSIIAGVGNNQLSGEGGDDNIVTFSGMNSVSGGLGSDLIIGGFQADRLFGDEGNDVIKGDASSFLAGSDIIEGGIGNDILMGGKGADTFVFEAGNGNNTIAAFNVSDVIFDAATGYSVTPYSSDFQSSIDHIQLVNFTTVDASNVMTSITDGANGAVFSAEGTSITFFGVDMASITENDFIFV